MLSIYIFRKKKSYTCAILRLELRKKGEGGWGVRALTERALENNEVFCFLYFYISKKKMTKYSSSIVVQLQFLLELQLEVYLEVQLELELESKLDDSGFPKMNYKPFYFLNLKKKNKQTNKRMDSLMTKNEEFYGVKLVSANCACVNPHSFDARLPFVKGES